MYEVRLTSLRGLASSIAVFHALLFFRIGLHGDVIKLRVQFDDPQVLLQQLLLTIFNGGSAVLLFFVLSANATAAPRPIALVGP